MTLLPPRPSRETSTRGEPGGGGGVAAAQGLLGVGGEWWSGDPGAERGDPGTVGGGMPYVPPNLGGGRANG